MKTEILEYNVNWNSIKRACMRTINKEAGKEPSQEWKRKILICRHSPIRKGVIAWKWSEIPEFVATHFARHHQGTEKFIQTEREDRTGVDRHERRQTDPVSMEMEANLEALANIAGRRLCYQADPATIEYCEDLKDAIAEYDEDIAWSMVPQCVRCGGCVETFGKCKFYENLMKDHALEEQQDVMKRYDIYRDYQKELKLKKGGR